MYDFDPLLGEKKGAMGAGQSSRVLRVTSARRRTSASTSALVALVSRNDNAKIFNKWRSRFNKESRKWWVTEAARRRLPKQRMAFELLIRRKASAPRHSYYIHSLRYDWIRDLSRVRRSKDSSWDGWEEGKTPILLLSSQTLPFSRFHPHPPPSTPGLPHTLTLLPIRVMEMSIRNFNVRSRFSTFSRTVPCGVSYGKHGCYIKCMHIH